MNYQDDTLDSLKAYMVTGFADMPRVETTLLLMNPYNICNPLGGYLLWGLEKDPHQDQP